MPCTPDFCDIHDYPVAPGGGWCRAVDVAYLRTQSMPRSGSHEEGLAGAILRLGDVLERMELGQPKPKPKLETRTQSRQGGTPL